MTPIEPTTSDKVATVLANAGVDGATWQEIAGILGLHHGAVSGALSRLEASAEADRLTEKRGGNSVYVLAQHRHGRRRATAKSKPLDEFLERMLSSYDDDGHCLALHGQPERLAECVDDDQRRGLAQVSRYEFVWNLRHLTGHDTGPFTKGPKA